MGKKYYIPNLPFFLKNLDEGGKALMKIQDNNILEVESERDFNDFITLIRNTEFVNDKEIKEFFDSNFPQIKFRKIPINLIELKRAFRFMFSDLPDELFEEEDTARLLMRVLNFVFRKKETQFIMLNVLNGRLEYKAHYRHQPILDFYYKMIKLTYDLDTYYETMCDAHKVIQRAILTEIFYTDKKFERKDLEVVNRGLNLTGQHFVALSFKLEEFLKEIREHKTFIKRSGIKERLPFDYDEQENEVIKKINQVLSSIEERRAKIDEAKNIIHQKLAETRGFLTKENAARIIEIVIDLFT